MLGEREASYSEFEDHRAGKRFFMYESKHNALACLNFLNLLEISRLKQ